MDTCDLRRCAVYYADLVTPETVVKADADANANADAVCARADGCVDALASLKCCHSYRHSGNHCYKLHRTNTKNDWNARTREGRALIVRPNVQVFTLCDLSDRNDLVRNCCSTVLSRTINYKYYDDCWLEETETICNRCHNSGGRKNVGMQSEQLPRNLPPLLSSLGPI